MANPLAKSIMNNISKNKIDKLNKIEISDSIKNINEKEEDILKSILYKNKNRVNINDLKKENHINQKSQDQFINKNLTQSNSKKTSLKELANKKEVREDSNNINPKNKQNKKIISLKDLAK